MVLRRANVIASLVLLWSMLLLGNAMAVGNHAASHAGHSGTTGYAQHVVSTDLAPGGDASSDDGAPSVSEDNSSDDTLALPEHFVLHLASTVSAELPRVAPALVSSPIGQDPRPPSV
ncbi:hypothetical protein [Frateuria defendens]|uniref:hypothetical protein n=1 Tax=Frateuria defendens TaxID=2219559 RepID=UPI00066FB4B3|nr:hypothetical protein [Frateuria defendens]